MTCVGGHPSAYLRPLDPPDVPANVLHGDVHEVLLVLREVLQHVREVLPTRMYG